MGPRSPNKPQCHLKLRMEFWERVTRMKLQTRKQHEAFATLNSVAEPVCRLRCLCWCRSWDAESFAGPASVPSLFGGSQGSLLVKRRFMARVQLRSRCKLFGEARVI